MPANAASASNSLNPFKQDYSLAGAWPGGLVPSDSFGACPWAKASLRGAAGVLDALFGVVRAAIWDRSGRRRHTPGQRVALSGGAD